MLNLVLNAAVILATLVATVPLGSVIGMVFARGLAHFRWSMLWSLPPGAGMEGGGFGNALAGTLVIVGLAALLSVPFGITTAVYLVEFPGRPRLVALVRFTSRVLSGLPSILAGVFVFATVVVTSRTFSLFAGALALAVLMLPVVTLATEEALRGIPHSLREGSYALGASATQTVLQVVLPAARSSILTGVSLAVARAAGETAPLVFTALFSDYWIHALFEPTASLSVLIYNFSGVPYENQLNLAWAASLVLILLVLAANVSMHWLSTRRDKR